MPKGSKIGGGSATGTAIALGITATETLTIFNGPGGHSLTMNFNILRPAAINATFSAPLTKVHGKYQIKLSAPVPNALQSVLDGDIVATRINVKT